MKPSAFEACLAGSKFEAEPFGPDRIAITGRIGKDVFSGQYVVSRSEAHSICFNEGDSAIIELGGEAQIRTTTCRED